MLKENLDMICFVVFAFLVIFGLVFTLNRSSKITNEKNLKDYTECKQRTNDLEWCFKNFRPILK